MPSRHDAPRAAEITPVPAPGLYFVGISFALGFAYALAGLVG